MQDCTKGSKKFPGVLDRKTFDFLWWTCYSIRNSEKGFDEDGQTSNVIRELAAGASQQQAV